MGLTSSFIACTFPRSMAIQCLPFLYWCQTQGLFVLSKHCADELYPLPSVAFKNPSNLLQSFQVYTGVPCEVECHFLAKYRGQAL